MAYVSGVEIDRFDETVWGGVAEAYVRSAYQLADDEIVTSERWFAISADEVKYGFGEYRLGSLITMHSKLLVCNMQPELLHFNFSANADRYELEYAEKNKNITPELIQDDFQARVTTFLAKLGIARQITDCVDIH